jgi:endonuclease/exonuclease/phosphatase family metal-dependent hydrolase
MRLYSSRAARLRAERGHRRRFRMGATIGAALLLATGTGIAALPAGAATMPAPHARVVAGNHAVTAAWGAVAGATRYTVRISTSSSLAHATVRQVTGLHTRFSSLTNGKRYYVGVTAEQPLMGITSAHSTVVGGTAASGSPYDITKVTVSTGSTANSIKVEWTGGGRNVKVGVVGASDTLLQHRFFHSAWLPSTTRSAQITVPSAYRTALGAGSGNPVFVKVVQSNTSSTIWHRSYDYADKYKLSQSTSNTWAFARPAATGEPVSPVTVGELNTQTAGATSSFSSGNQWSNRVDRVAKTVEASGAGVLMTAELSTSLVSACSNHPTRNEWCTGHTQYMDLAGRLPGYRVATEDSYVHVMKAMKTSPYRWDGKITNGSQIFYKPAALTLEDHGYIAPAMTTAETGGQARGLDVSGWTPALGDRWLSWAKFVTNDAAHREFYAVAAHFPVGTSDTIVNIRVEEAAKVTAYLDSLAGNLPIVFAGDLNADSARDPKPAAATFIADHYFDAAATPSKAARANIRYSTSNGSGPQDGADPGYPTRPYIHPYPTSRIDYIMLKNSPHTYSYANTLHRTSTGDFDRSYQGSDHNMQVAEVGIAAPH